MELMRTHPFIVVKVEDKPVHEVFYQRLLTATITDHAGNEADSFEAEFDDSGNDLNIPQSNNTLQVMFSYENSISASMGRFVVESFVSSGGRDGKILRLCGKSASMRKEIKEQSSKHFDNQTVCEIVEALAKRYSYQAKINPEFYKYPLPYVVRNDQSTVDFLIRLADRMQVRFLIKDNKFLFLGQDSLPALELHKHECSSLELYARSPPQIWNR